MPLTELLIPHATGASRCTVMADMYCTYCAAGSETEAAVIEGQLEINGSGTVSFIIFNICS